MSRKNLKSQKRNQKRSHLTRAEVKAQKKVGDRYLSQRTRYREMSFAELIQIKELKRSATDEHAFKSAFEEKDVLIKRLQSEGKIPHGAEMNYSNTQLAKLIAPVEPVVAELPD